MNIHFVDKNGRDVILRASAEEQADIILRLLLLVPDSEFIIKPHK